MHNEARGLVNTTVIHIVMETSEILIWFFMPVTLSTLIGLFLKERKWFSFYKLIAIGVLFGVAGVLLAPTTLCTSPCDKVISASTLSLIINSVLINFVILWMKGNNNEHV